MQVVALKQVQDDLKKCLNNENTFNPTEWRDINELNEKVITGAGIEYEDIERLTEYKWRC